ncbi:MAG: RNA polymerase sigma factor RpoD/SigA [Acidobacteriota bacterium]
MRKFRQPLSPSTLRYLSEISKFPILTLEQERGLAWGLNEGSRASLEKLVQSNLSFVVKIASEYRNLGLSFEDLLNEGNVGLLEAARRYDCSKGTKFITYAIWWIRKSILKALAEQSTMVRLPSYQVKKYRRISGAESALTQKLGRKPERSEISERLGERGESVDQVLCHRVRELSLDERVGREQGASVSEFLVDGSLDSPEESLIRSENSRLLHAALLNLNGQEREVLVGRFGLNGENGMTLREIGHSMSLSRERVRQIENQAKRKIRRFFERYTCGTEALWGVSMKGGDHTSRRRLVLGRHRRA